MAEKTTPVTIDDWDAVARRLWPVRAWMARHHAIVDWSVVLGCAGIQCAIALLSGYRWSVPALILQAVAPIALLWRRRYPFATLFAVVAVDELASLLQPNTSPSLPFAVALFTIADLQGLRRSLLAYLAGVLIPIIATLIQSLDTQAGHSPTIIDPLAVISLAAGIAVRSQRERRETLAQLWQERAEHAVLAERARITADMHDVVAHSISTMIALANGAESAWEKYPERAASALRKLSAVGRSALNDMSKMLRLLPDEDPGAGSTEPRTSRRSLEDLIETFRSTGMPVHFAQRGEQHLADPGLQMTIYRIVQESLTNALRYAVGAQRAEVTIATDPDHVDVTVTDDAPRTKVSRIGAGRGLAGIADRAASYNGTSHAGPRPEGGWCTHVTLQRDKTQEAREQ